MPDTTNWDLPYPAGNAAADVPADIRALAEKLDDRPPITYGPASSRPVSTVGTPGQEGRYYFSTDGGASGTGILEFDTGAGWRRVGLPQGGEVTAAMIAAALKPSGSAAAGDEALRALGTVAGTACAGNDSRLTRPKQVHGQVTASGSIAKAGSGDWSVTRYATGQYRITFSPAFSAAPTFMSARVIAGTLDADAAINAGPTSSQIEVITGIGYPSFTANNYDFSFLVIA